ncbi:MAG: recombinase family protein [Rickettsiales bacterium]|jgi:DNA invertase Pin-like site-specific DNA recombinase|nr:recombinase family protein [Rickettsiales bacterium]
MKGQRVGYVRCSSVDQNTERQLAGVELDKVFEDKLSGKDTNRPQLQAMLDFVREGDIILVHSLDRLARNLGDLKKIVDDLVSRGVTIQFMKENLTFTSDKKNPMSELLLNVMGAFAQFERDLIKERQREGIAIAKIKGAYKGRKKALNKEQVAELKRMIANGENKTKVAKEFNISRFTLYNYLNQTK